MNASLEQVREAFASWRSIGKQRGYPSNALKQMALELLPEHSFSAISALIGVPAPNIKRWHQVKERSNEQEPVFIPLSPNVSQANSKAALDAKNLSIKFPNHVELVISTSCIDSVCKVISSLAKELLSCSI